jgi:hypothetical protein
MKELQEKETEFKMKRLSLKEYTDLFEERFGKDHKNWKVKCPHCGEVQSIQDFLELNIEDPMNKWGFSCIGRWDKKRGCDWTLGGLFQIHHLEVLDEEGNAHPRFEVAEAKE